MYMCGVNFRATVFQNFHPRPCCSIGLGLALGLGLGLGLGRPTSEIRISHGSQHAWQVLWS